MKYILDSSGYVESASCNPISCDDKVSQEYTGAIPDGYETLDEWILNANIRAYKIVNNNLVYDAEKDAALQAEWENKEAGVICESGSNERGSFIKYSNGTMICHGFATGASDLYDYWGIFKRTHENLQAYYPKEFTDFPEVYMTPNYSTSSFVAIPTGRQTNYFEFVCLKPSGTTDTNYEVSYMAIGKWK